ncbi:MAG: aldo/keto reductase [Thermomicrobiales bacterium]|nr:aldo/keto reductase [Thermomicrobiales bacterium]MCO5220058.1 aldo/keto reductase [Thermomicrobiales bacterium]
MQHRRFGNSALRSSVIGFGTWPIGGARYGPSDDAEATAAIHAALDAGITLFDTAPTYGNGHAEELLGTALTGRRDQAVVVTKGGMISDENAFITGLDSSREHLARGLDESLARLKTDYVDIYLLHWPDGETPLADIAASLGHLVESGKTRAVVVCNLDKRQLREIAGAATDSPIVASQVGFSLLDRRWANETFALCDELGIGVMAYGPLAHGLLTGAYTRETSFDDRDWRKAGVIFGQPLLTPENRERNLQVIDTLAGFAAEKNVSLVQLAIAWVLAHAPVTVALTGARNTSEILGCVAAAEVTLDTADLAAIDTIMQNAAGMTDVLPAGGTSKATATAKQGA